MKSSIFLMYCLIATGCATVPKPAAKAHYVGRCFHPVLGQAIPVDTDSGSTFDGSTWYGKLPDGGESVITGASCVLRRLPE